MTTLTMKPATPVWFWATAGLGLVWNAYGVMQFTDSLQATPDGLMATGLTKAQVAVMMGYPAWMTVAFAIGVFGGLAGCILLLMRRSIALPVFAASLAGYVVLYIGDMTQGVFAALGAPQVIILTAVVLIAAGLLAAALRARKSGLLS
jgi:hypothetical protein